MNHSTRFDFITFIKDNWKIIIAIFSIISLIVFAFTLSASFADIEKEKLAVEKWYEQLPEDDWLKKDQETSVFMNHEIIELFEGMKSLARGSFDLAMVDIGQQGMLGSLIEGSFDTAKDIVENKYELRDTDNKRIRGYINIPVGGASEVVLYYDDVKLMLSFSQEDYFNQVINYSSKYPSLANKLVFSYSDDPDIATIYDGKICGHKKGKTIIHFFTNGYFFNYRAKVK